MIMRTLINTFKFLLIFTAGLSLFAASAYAGWSTEIVDSEGCVGTQTSLVIDNNGHLHITYFDNTNYDLKYAYFAGAESFFYFFLFISFINRRQKTD